MNGAALKNRRFVSNMVVKGMNQTRAYAEANGDKKITNSHMSSASRLLRNDKVQELIKRMRQKYVRDSARAYAQQWELAEKETTPPHVKNAIYKDVQDRAGLGAIEMHYTEHKHKFEELDMSKNELLNLITEPEKLIDDERINKK